MEKKRWRIRKHHVKLTALFASKIFLVLLGFFIGLVIGTITENVWVTLFIAFAVAVIFYIISILHLIDWLNLG